MRQWSGLLAPALLVVLAACGGESSIGDSGQEPASSVTVDGSAPDTTPATTPDSTSDITSDATSDMTNDAESAWCELARGVDQASLLLDEADLTDPDSVEAAFDEMYERMLAARPAAPVELTSAIEVSLEAFEQLRNALIAVGWDFVDADLSAFDEMAADLEVATAEIDGYTDRVCGTFLTDADAGDGGVDPIAGSIRDQVIAALVGEGFSRSEAECLFDNIDFTDPDAANDIAQITPAFESCGIDLARLDELGG